MILRLTIGGFPLSPELSRTFIQLREDTLLSRSKIEIGQGGIAGAVAHYQTAATPQLVIVEADEDVGTLQGHLEQLAEVCVKGTQVIVVGRLNDIATYRRLIGLGVGDYLVAPVTPAQLAASIETLFAEPGAQPNGKLIAFAAARGGAGSSTLSHNTAWTLAQRPDEEVIAVDLDLAFGTLGLAFNVDPRQTVAELLKEPERMDAQLIERVLVSSDERLKLLPSPGLAQNGLPIEVETVDRLLGLLRRMASVVVVDLPHQWSPWVAHAVEVADEAVIVATPDLPGLRDSKAMIDHLASRRGAREPARLVLNKLDQLKKTQLAPKDFEEALKIKPSCLVQFEPLFGEAQNEGQMVGKLAKQKLADQLTALANLVGPKALRPVQRSRAGFPDWLKKFKPAAKRA
jgi:pilus assembly protein CpaE